VIQHKTLKILMKHKISLRGEMLIMKKFI